MSQQITLTGDGKTHAMLHWLRIADEVVELNGHEVHPISVAYYAKPGAPGVLVLELPVDGDVVIEDLVQVQVVTEEEPNE